MVSKLIFLNLMISFNFDHEENKISFNGLSTNQHGMLTHDKVCITTSTVHSHVVCRANLFTQSNTNL